jgi:hypothetical protein
MLLGVVVLVALFLVSGVLGLTRLAVARLYGGYQLDFGVYYLAGAILESPEPNGLYSMERLELEAEKRDMPHFIREDSRAPYVYPPLLAVLMRRVSRLPYHVAESAWLGFNACAILISAIPLVTWNERRRRGIGMYLAISLFLALYTPGHSALMLGQVSPLLLCSLSWAFLFLVSRRFSNHSLAHAAAGFLIGFASFIKVFPILLLAFLMWRRKFRVVGWTIVSICVYTIVCLLGSGVSNTAYFFFSFLPSFYRRRAYGGFVYDQSFSAALVRWLGPTRVVPWFSLGFSALVVLVTVFVLVRSRRAVVDSERLGIEFSLVLTASILVLTYTTLNYYLLLLIPMAALWFSSGKRAARAWPVLGCIALICVYSLVLWAFARVGYLIPFGLIAVLSLWGALVVRVGHRVEMLRSEEVEMG